MSQWVENVALGDWLCGWVKRLRLYKGKGAGEPICLRPWQERKFIRDLLSVVDKDTGLRRYTEAFYALPKKNGKSTLIAAIVVLLLCADGELGAEVYSAASTRAQASIVFRTVAHMIRKDPWLRKRCKINDTLKRIIFLPTGGFYQALSADSDYTDGIDASAVIYDELHRAPNSALYDLLKNSMGARKQPLFITITTAGSDKATICGEVWDYAIKVRDGVVKNEQFLPCIYAADPKDDWTDPAVWHKCNPALGDFLSLKEMTEQCERAKQQPSIQAAFKRYRLNIWCESDEAWLPMTSWDACEVTLPDLKGRECYAGVDLSNTSDLTAIVLWFPDDEGEGGFLEEHFFCPQENLVGRQEATGVPYTGWAEEGYLTPTPGNVVDYDAARQRLNDLRAEGIVIKQVRMDPYNSTQLATDLLADGFEVVLVPPTIKHVSPASKQFERLVMSKRCRHGHNPVMRWMVSNAKIYMDGLGNIRPCKRRSKAKIDGVAGSVIALSGAMTPEDDTGAFESAGSYVI